MDRWSVERAQKWYAEQPWLVGCNFLPGTAINQVEMFQPETFDPETIRCELGWARDLGFNTLRVYLHDMLWKDEVREGFLASFDAFLGICESLGMRCIIVFFDDCHWDHTIALGAQHPRITGVHNSGWLKCPGRPLNQTYQDGTASEEDHARLQGYVKDIMDRYRSDSRILMWDIYNEPGHPASKRLLEDAWNWAKEAAPSQPLTGCHHGAGPDYAAFQSAQSDVLSFHCYHREHKQAKIDELGKLHPDRPIICTEYMGRPDSTFQSCLPILKENNVGAINWGLVNGKSGTVWRWPSQQPINEIVSRENWSLTDIEASHGFDQPAPGENYPEPKLWFHDIFRVDGTPFDAEEVAFIKGIVSSG
ncbi:MAG: cellulase family glycosylhydrolase [Kiritimatiellae bacterium]|nr:cellulase family glycosylhydrolase [Kiritimatiellia bacterium]